MLGGPTHPIVEQFRLAAPKFRPRGPKGGRGQDPRRLIVRFRQGLEMRERLVDLAVAPSREPLAPMRHRDVAIVPVLGQAAVIVDIASGFGAVPVRRSVAARRPLGHILVFIGAQPGGGKRRGGRGLPGGMAFHCHRINRAGFGRIGVSRQPVSQLGIARPVFRAEIALGLDGAQQQLVGQCGDIAIGLGELAGGLQRQDAAVKVRIGFRKKMWQIDFASFVRCRVSMWKYGFPVLKH